LVLKGAFRDQTDHFGPGDVEVANEDLEHTPVADIGEDCICLAA
ncbi:MAG TPA: transcriptional regulator, partial [Rhodobacteraceae bacterium]|nr:transcriptional regulator [Paracoccaceae bacterium]